MNWLIFGTYILGLLLSTSFFARRLLSYWHNDPANKEMLDGIDNADRWAALLFALVAATFWPAVLAIYVLGKAVNPDRWLRSDREIQEAERVELEHLRALAKRYNLPMGD